ncbi:SEFIR domain-containing protein [Flavobacterium sp. 9]|uniref:AbiTii domain-containing protein n=1 Tax=Flavobacterium sp. 9 TaxID=2035198 RepID=UPI000C38A396|nr:SEFIR domain-containing protein [Flavobacterium sp. 9]PIF29692.1 SEFIR domain-containing protein [Flavobacterium sp. 9]
MEDFLKKLYNTENTLSLLLLEAKVIAEQKEDKELLSYIEKEIEGYKIEDGIPEYRKVKAEIVCDIKDIYGQLVFREKTIDFKPLSDRIGFDLEVAYLPDGISFLETTLKNLTQNTSIKPIPKELVKMLDKTFHHNNKSLHLDAAYHKLPTATIEYVLVKVRQDLIQAFQKLNRKTDTSVETILLENEDSLIKTPVKSVFVTYAWNDDAFNSLVISFVDFLRQNNFDASMDRMKSQGETAINFNQMMVEGISNNDKIIIILSEQYKKRADKFEGGVGTEFKIILEDMKKNKNKYIFASFGTSKRETIAPLAIAGIDILDLKDDQDNHSFNNLFSKLKEENILQFSDISTTEVEIKKVEIKPFKL